MEMRGGPIILITVWVILKLWCMLIRDHGMPNFCLSRLCGLLCTE
jgi:hypothetical protein